MNRYIKVLLISVFVLGIAAMYFSYNSTVKASSVLVENGELSAYAAAFASLENNRNKSKDEMLSLSAKYLEDRNNIESEIFDYLKKNSIVLANADNRYEEACKEVGRNYLTPEEYEEKIPEEVKEVIRKRNAFLEEMEEKQQELDSEYRIDQLPVLYYSIEELKDGLEESLWILDDYDKMMEGKTEPEMKGYSKEDFYRLLDERIQAEKNVLNQLVKDSSPDLYNYSLMLYRERKEHPVIY